MATKQDPSHRSENRSESKKARDNTLTTTTLLEGTEKSTRRWPIHPKPVKRSAFSTASDFAVDLTLMACCFGFLAFALTVRFYDREPTEKHQRLTNILLEASRYGPSIFPILFACVVGRAAQAVLQWRLERGACVGFLDTLAGSTSLTSTVTSQLKLRVVSLLGLSLVVLWALSPIGGQASLRQMAIGKASAVEPASFTYMVPRQNLSGYANSYTASSQAIANAFYISSIIAPVETKNSTLDTWGNVKIPLIEYHEQEVPADQDGWFTPAERPQVYSSLTGVPIDRHSRSAMIDYNMTLETSYFHLDCPIFLATWNDSKTPITGPPAQVEERFGFAMWSFENSTDRTLANPMALRPRKFGYVTWGLNGLSECTISTTYVEAAVRCDGMAPCAVSKLRRSQREHPPPGYTSLDTWFTGMTWDIFVLAFMSSIQGHPFSDTPAQAYIQRPDDPLRDILDQPVPPTRFEFETRLGQLINTYWICLNGPSALSGGMTPWTAWMKGSNTSTSSDLMPSSDTVLGSITTRYPIIVAQHGWIIALSVASSLMILASVIHPIVYLFLSRGPDLALNYSSLATRDNPYIDTPDEGSYLDAADRARLMEKVQIQLCDVEADAAIGRLAVASVGSDTAASRSRVRKGRLYR